MNLRKSDLLLLVLGIAVFAILQGLISVRIIGSFWQLNLLIIGINIILSASLNLINGYTGQFSLGHAGFMAVGAYVGVVLTTNFHVPFLAALVVGGLAAAALGVLIGLPTLRLRGDYLAIATLGFAEIIRAVFQWDKLGPLTNGSNLLRNAHARAAGDRGRCSHRVERTGHLLRHDLSADLACIQSGIVGVHQRIAVDLGRL